MIAQEFPTCGIVDTPLEPVSLVLPEALSPCFDVNSIYQNCTPVYINVNLHVFTDNSCEGVVHQLGTDQILAFQLAENIVARSNSLAADNKEQWPKQEPPVIICNPIQYVLKGIYMHCAPPSSSGVSVELGDLHDLQLLYAVNPQTELNIYVTNNEPNQAWNGIASGFGSDHAALTVEFESTFNHEIGHLLSLRHPNGYSNADHDGCADTNPTTHTWDKNCNGILEYSEKFRLCWSYIDPASEEDTNGNGIPDCQELAPCTPNPCCGWSNQNNNLMLSTGAYLEALSNCQVNRMLSHLANVKCDYIAQIGGAAPPNAFITQTASDIANTAKKCDDCLVLSASFNDVAHCLYIYKGTGNTLVYSTGWVNEPASRFCYSVGKQVLGNPLFEPDTKYTALLTVRNSAGVEDYTTYEFITPSGKCELDPHPPMESKLAVSPNPGNGTIQIVFQGHSGTIYSLRAIHQISGTVHSINDNYLALEGENTVAVNSSVMSAGFWIFELSGGVEPVQTLFLKL